MFYLKKAGLAINFLPVQGGSSNDILLQNTVVSDAGAVKLALEHLVF